MKKTRKKPTVTKLKKELDRLFSIYIRRRWSDDRGYGQCFTCRRVALYTELQCGHFIPRQVLALRYDERNCRPQCVGCNVFGRGKIAEFGARLEEENPGITAQLFRESQKIVKDFPYEALIEKYGKPEHLLHQATGKGEHTPTPQHRAQL